MTASALRPHAAVGAPLWPTAVAFDPAAVDRGAPGLWRYRAFLGLPDGAPALTLGEGWTPLVPGRLDGAQIRFKLEFAQPTGSYKDRGFAPLFASLSADGIQAVVEDSSGNAGASAAAYGAAAGIDVTLFLPGDAAAGARTAQALAYGAKVDAAAGSRAEAAGRAEAAVRAGAVYASHVRHPVYLAGLRTIAFEIFEQLGRAPDDVVVPVGHGGLLLGLALGFDALVAGGCVERAPRLHGVQAAAAAPLAAAFARGAASPAAVAPSPTCARGIAIGDPPRGAAVLAAVRRSGGSLSALDEDSIRTAHAALARRGWYVEPTSAVVAPVARRLAEAGPAGRSVVAVLTGSGLKISPPARQE